MLLSQMRLVLCESNEQPSGGGVAIPLYQIYDEDIRQPIFGCSNIVADVQVLGEGFCQGLDLWRANPNRTEGRSPCPDVTMN